MDIGQVGPAGASRHPERLPRVDSLEASAAAPQLADLASISPHGRDYLAAVESLTRKLEHQEGVREARTREVRQQLANGDLDDDRIYRAVAETIFDLEGPEAD